MANDNPMPKPQLGNESAKDVAERLNPTHAPESKAGMPDDKAHMGAKEEDVKQTRPPTNEMTRIIDQDRDKADDDDESPIDAADVLTTPG